MSHTGLHDLRYKAGILHRDISVNNIMYEIQDNAYYFILIDFDMAIFVEDKRGNSTYKTSSKHRTGTLPFISFELILDVVEGLDDDASSVNIVGIPCGSRVLAPTCKGLVG